MKTLNKEDYPATEEGEELAQHAAIVFAAMTDDHNQSVVGFHGWMLGLLFSELYPKKARLLIGDMLNGDRPMPDDIYEAFVEHMKAIKDGPQESDIALAKLHAMVAHMDGAHNHDT